MNITKKRIIKIINNTNNQTRKKIKENKNKLIDLKNNDTVKNKKKINHIKNMSLKNSINY